MRSGRDAAAILSLHRHTNASALQCLFPQPPQLCRITEERFDAASTAMIDVRESMGDTAAETLAPRGSLVGELRRPWDPSDYDSDEALLLRREQLRQQQEQEDQQRQHRQRERDTNGDGDGPIAGMESAAGGGGSESAGGRDKADDAENSAADDGARSGSAEEAAAEVSHKPKRVRRRNELADLQRGTLQEFSRTGSGSSQIMREAYDFTVVRNPHCARHPSLVLACALSHSSFRCPFDVQSGVDLPTRSSRRMTGLNSNSGVYSASGGDASGVYGRISSAHQRAGGDPSGSGAATSESDAAAAIAAAIAAAEAEAAAADPTAPTVADISHWINEGLGADELADAMVDTRTEVRI